MKVRRTEKNKRLVQAIIAVVLMDREPCRYFIGGYIDTEQGKQVTISQWEDGQKALDAVDASNYEYAIVYDSEADLVMKVKGVDKEAVGKKPPKMNAQQAQMLLRLYTGTPSLTGLLPAEVEILSQLVEMGYCDGLAITPYGISCVCQMMGWTVEEQQVCQ